MRLLACFLALAAAAVLGAPAVAVASPSVTEFTAGLRTASAPTGIAEGPDGALWFTEQAAPGGIGRITTAGQVTRFTAGLSTDSPPYAIAAGPDGNLWFTENAHKGRVGRITLQGVVKEWGRGDDTNPSGITAGPDGNVWFAEPGKDGRIGRITPGGKTTDFTSGLTKESAPTDITAGPDGNLWFTESVDPGRIGRITPAGVITEFPLTGAGGPPREITTGPDGNLWFTVGGSPGRLGRITPAGAVTLFPALATGADPVGIVTGPDGALYVAQRGRAAIARVTTSGAVTELAGLSSGATGIALGPDGALWTTQSANPGRIARVTLPPTVVAPVAGSVHSTSATLGATVRSQSQATTFRVEYGPTVLYGLATPDASAGAGAGAQAVAATVAGLGPSTTYHFRVVATNASGTTYGPDATFSTTPPGAPSATAEEATAVTPTGALLHGLVDAQSAPTTYRFEWGTTTSYDSPLPTPEPGVAAQSGDQPVQWSLSGLRPNTTYHYRVTATNATGTTSSEDRTFTTPPVLPVVQAYAATDVGADAATLAGSVNPGNASTVWYVEWGTSSAYGSVAGADVDTLDAGLQDRAVSLGLTGLAPDTTYHYRLVAVNSAGVTEGPDRTFRTGAVPPVDVPADEPAPDAAPPTTPPTDAPATPAGPAAATQQPTLGRTVVVRALSGIVRFRAPGSRRYTTLKGARGIPVGALIDASAGKLTLTSALDRKAATQTGTFWGGAFRVRQDRSSRGMTEIVLAGGRPSSCATARAAAATSKRKPRGVWGSDRHGRFRTRGSNSVATVRGTRWYVEERCTGTLTRVASGAVVVRDLAKRRDVVVKAGHSYLARPRSARR